MWKRKVQAAASVTPASDTAPQQMAVDSAGLVAMGEYRYGGSVADRRKLFESAGGSKHPAPAHVAAPRALPADSVAAVPPSVAGAASVPAAALASPGPSAPVVSPASARAGEAAPDDAPRARDYTLYRADTRTLERMRTDFPAGFSAWVPLGVEGARTFMGAFLGGRETSGLPAHVVGQIGKWGNPKLRDLSQYIKYTKDKSTVWVSTAINTEAGGQSSGAPLHKISAHLYEFEIVDNRLVPLPDGRRNALKPSLLLDAPTLEASSLIALNHGPLHDAEISFFTPIPLSMVESYP